MDAMTHRVLLVDDEPALLSSLRRVVERARPDAIVVYASDADTAVWQIETTAIRLVLTDLRMQGQDEAGLAVVQAALSAGVKVAGITGTRQESTIHTLEKDSVPLMTKSSLSATRLAEIVDDAFRI